MRSNRVAIHDDRRSPKSTLEIVIINSVSYLIFLGIAIFIMWAQISHHAFIAGTDSAFHMNRFYETAMQLKTGHFSYFQSLFGFHQTGRIVTAFYGPLMAYLCGGLLLLCRNWINFQIVNSLLVLSLSGWFMYILCVKSHVKRWAALILGTMYMTCYPVSIWPTAQKFTGLGAAFLPLAVLCGMRMLNAHRIRVLALALVMTLIVQTHLVSSLVAAMALLPMFVVGWWHADRRERALMLTNGFKAIGLTILLSGNVWGSIIDMFTTNHIIPVFPQQDLIAGTIHFYHFHLTYLGWIMTIVALLDLIALVVLWKHRDYQWKTITLTGLFFLWLSSPWFPWTWMHRYLTQVTNVIQFPRRFLIIAIILFLLSFGQICSPRLPRGVQVKPGFKLRDVKYVLLLVFMIGAVAGLRQTIDQEVERYTSPQVLNEPAMMLHVYQPHAKQLRHDFGSDDLALSVRDVTKSTPDYLPSSSSLATNRDYYRIHPYHLENVQLDAPRTGFRHRVVGRDRLRVSWINPRRTARKTILPMVAYSQSHVRINGRRVRKPRITSVGAIRTLARPGRNVATVEFKPDFSFELMMLITVVTWIVLIVNRTFYRKNE